MTFHFHQPSTRPIDPDLHSCCFFSVASSLIAQQVAVRHQIRRFVPIANIPTRLEHIQSSLHPIWVSLCRRYSYIYPSPDNSKSFGGHKKKGNAVCPKCGRLVTFTKSQCYWEVTELRDPILFYFILIFWRFAALGPSIDFYLKLCPL